MTEETPEEELETLNFATVDIEPEQPKPIKVVLGGRTYVARCPNDYEFANMVKHLAYLQDNPSSFDIGPILKSFFDNSDASSIEKHCVGSDPSIRLIADLLPCLNALAEHYKPQIENRMKTVQKKVSSTAKKG